MSLKSIFLIRHAESPEDIDPTLHNINNDRGIPLTETGILQADNLGQQLSVRFFPENTIAVYLSPLRRVGETWNILAPYFPAPMIKEVDERLRNLDWGNVNLETRDQIEAERYKAGVLNYQFPGGDDTPKYVRSINDFTDKATTNRQNKDSPDYIIIVTHGFALRIIIRALLQTSDTVFKWLRHPPNGYCLELTYNTETSTFTPTTPLLRRKPIE